MHSWHTGMFLSPDAVSRRGPLVDVFAAAEDIAGGSPAAAYRCLWAPLRLTISPSSSGFSSIGQGLMVVVERLALVIFLGTGLLQALQQALVVDVGVGAVDKDAGLHIAGRVDGRTDGRW